MLDSKTGEFLVRTARRAVEEHFEKSSTKNSKKRDMGLKNAEGKGLDERHGVFVTIKTFPECELRGCIGCISAVQLHDGVKHMALSAAFEDPRFPALKKEELVRVIFEVSVMTEPMLVRSDDYKGLGDMKEMEKSIKIGRDGLIISNGYYNGLLLPQVPVEQKWDVEEFLKNLCYKAGMTTDFLDDENTKIWKFQCQVFAERSPGGKIEEVKF